jgi:hypothetical protein
MESDSMRISRMLRPKLPASMASRLIYSPLGDTMKHDEIGKEITTQFTVPLRTVGNFTVSDLAIKFISVYKNLQLNAT